MKVSVDQVYTSVACNRIPEIVDWNREGLICFGASNAVVVYDTKAKGKDPLTVLSHHKGRVNSVKWVTRKDGRSSEILSCSADKTAAIWSLKDRRWKVTSVLSGHGDGVTCIHGVYNEDLIVYTGCIDSNIRVWERRNGTTSLKQTINLHSGLCLTLFAHLLPHVNKPTLFCALDDHKIHVFAGEEYHRVHTLVGHEDWVRGMDVLDVDLTKLKKWVVTLKRRIRNAAPIRRAHVIDKYLKAKENLELEARKALGLSSIPVESPWYRIDNKSMMLASASQDMYIRLWRIQRHVDQPQVNGIKVEEKVFEAYGVAWSVKLDAVLAGHEGWVYGVQWQPSMQDSNPTYRLLSSSLDKTLIVWEPESHGGAWVESVRVGEVGGNGLGFYGSRFGPGDQFLGHGYNGSFHIWSLNKETNQWQPRVVCGGHVGGVEDVRWEARGRYVASVALDQTTRVHAPWRTNGSDEWHEVARPQVHGYDMASLAVVSATSFVSAAEEKVLRVFRAPHTFVLNFRNITGELLDAEDGSGAEGASVPSLGLSNKAVFSGPDATPDEENDGYFVPVELHEPPTEEALMQHTLWPEVQKLYGHGYEVYCVDASADGSLVASACKATTPEHAAVLIWETATWQQTQKLVSHQLTVTQLAFSPDSRRLLSVSRDRRWTLFQRRQDSNSFDVSASTDKTNGVHGRIIWCCAWARDGGVFATGSRDGKVCMWAKSEWTSDTSLKDYSLVGKPLELANTSVTALAFAPTLVDDTRVLATGFESGAIRIYGCSDEWTLLYELDNSAAHHLTVKRLAFKPHLQDESTTMLASCGSDNFVRIHRILMS